MTGTTLGRYELLEKLGEGGMGVVYKARDTVLNRPAALKMLAGGAALTDDHRSRFLQEAQSASALNHPNIVTVYEIELSPPHEFIAMEYVPGRTLESLIGRSGLPLKDALAYAIQVADALAAAHAAGITHRDVKPANVLISESGQAKVLDFGLAKLADRAAEAPVDMTRTLALGHAPRTIEGTIAGTVSYMSPEQAEGKRVDYRSDVFSFGALLYEMLTGRRAFQGESTVSTLASILQSEPAEITTQLPGIPRELGRIMRRCLEKSRERRWQSMADVRMALEDVRQDMQSAQPQQPALTKASKRWPAAVAIALAAAALGAAAVWNWPKSQPQAELYTYRRLTSDTAANVSPAISPDGKLIAYASDRAGEGHSDIWVQQVAGGDAVKLTSGLGMCHDPLFSPDGSKILFRGGPDASGIYVISALGGTSRRLASGRAASFSTDGSEVVYTDGDKNRILIIPATGGTPREVPAKRPAYGRAFFVAGGKRLLFTSASGNELEWFVIGTDGSDEAATGAVQQLKTAGFESVRPGGITADSVYFAHGPIESVNLYRVPFDFVRARITAAPSAVTSAPGLNFWPTASADGKKVAFANASRFNSTIWKIPLDENGVASGEPKRITDGLQETSGPFPSKDGKFIAYNARVGGVTETRVRNLETGEESRIGESSASTPPVISGDGQQIAYGVREKEKIAIYAGPIRGGVPRRLCEGCGRPIEWFADASKILHDRSGKDQGEIAVLDVATSKTTTIVRYPGHQVFTPRISPDGRWLIFTAVMGPRDRRIYVAPFSGDQPIDESKWSVVFSGTGVERQPFWSPNGQMIYYLSERDGFRCVWAQKIDPNTMKAVGADFAVKHFHQFRYSLLDFDDVVNIGLSVVGKNLYQAIREMESNIWLAERRPEPK